MAMDPPRSKAEQIKLGMLFLGLVFSSMLYGISLIQTYTYFRRFPRDPKTIKGMVACITILGLISAVLVTHACWYYLITNGSIGVAIWSLNAELALSMVISAIAESFLAYRVWMLSGNRKILTFVLLTLALLHLVSGEWSAARFFQLRRFSKFSQVMVPSILRLSSAALCDTGIAVSLCYFLQQKRTGYKETDQIIDHLIMFSINSGLLTSVSSISCLVTYILVPKAWVYVGLCFLISRLYANTFLSSLNSRQVLLQEDDESPLPRFHTATLGRDARFGKRRAAEKTSPTPISVMVITETLSHSDASKNTSVQAQAHQRLDSESERSDLTSESETSCRS